MSRPPREVERWIRLRSAVSETVRCWVSDDVTVAEAVERATPEHVSRSMRADAEWLTEQAVERVEEQRGGSA